MSNLKDGFAFGIKLNQRYATRDGDTDLPLLLGEATGIRLQQADCFAAAWVLVCDLHYF